MPFPEKQYTRLEALLERWKLSRDDVFYAIENGLLHCCIRLQPRYVERGSEEKGFFRAKTCECCDGMVMLRPEDCQVIFQSGEVQAHSFLSMQQPRELLRITHEPPQPFMCVRLQHMLVMKDEQRRFEDTYHVHQRKPRCNKHKRRKRPRHIASKPKMQVFNNYKQVELYSRTYHLGPVQADITKQLHEVSESDDPWIHGKTLLANSGSQAMRFQDVFKNKKGWRGLIESDGRGYYRLNIPSQQFHKTSTDNFMEQGQSCD